MNPQNTLITQQQQQQPPEPQYPQKSNIFVSVRIRPLSAKESEFSKTECLTIQNQNTLSIENLDVKQMKAKTVKEQQYTYDLVFNKNSSQAEVYENTTKILLNSILNGFNATVFAYGATGSGKTYTMLGTGEQPGIMPRAITDLFNYVRGHGDKEYKIKFSYLEIYNENIRDLLGNEKKLDIREDNNKGIIISGLKEFEVEDTNTFFGLLLKGNNNRHVGETNQNEQSSRSHAVLQINIFNKNKSGNNTNEITTSKFILVDLAGSERASKNLNSVDNKTKQEGSNINKSLLALGNCINALSDGNKFIAWRESKLTRILKDSLIGNGRIVMISTVSPSLLSIDETINTLVYANRAKNIQTTLKKNTISINDNIDSQIKYKEVISNLQDELEGLRNQLAVKTNNQHLLNFNNDKNEDAKIDKLSKEIGNHFQEEIRIKNEIIDMEKNIDNMKENIKDKEYSLFKVINSKMNRGNSMKEKEIRSQINRLNEQINIQKGLLYNKESKYNELMKKREYFENAINKFSNPNNSSLTILQYLYNGYIFEVNNLTNEFIRKRNLNLIRQKDLKIQKLLEQLKIRDEYITNEKKELEKKKIKFFYEGENNIKRVEDLSIEKPLALPVLIQQQVISGNKTPLKKTLYSSKNSRVASASFSRTGGKFDYSGYSNPNIVKEKQVIKTKTNEIMNKGRKNELTELRLNMLNAIYKNSKVMYVNKRHKKNKDKFNNDDSVVITFDTRNLNKSHSNASFTSKKSQSDLNKSRGNLGFMEREIDNKIKNIIGGRIRKGPYVRK